MVLQPKIVAIDADQLFRLVVPGSHLVVGHRPVYAMAIARERLEVVRPHAERVTRPVIGASAEHPAAPPHELRALGRAVWLVRDFPAAIDRRVVIAEGLVGRARATQRSVV